MLSTFFIVPDKSPATGNFNPRNRFSSFQSKVAFTHDSSSKVSASMVQVKFPSEESIQIWKIGFKSWILGPQLYYEYVILHKNAFFFVLKILPQTFKQLKIPS